MLAGEVLSVSTDDIVTTAVTGGAPWNVTALRLPALLLLKLAVLLLPKVLSSADAEAAGACTARPPPLLRLGCGVCLQQPPQHRRQQRNTLQEIQQTALRSTDHVFLSTRSCTTAISMELIVSAAQPGSGQVIPCIGRDNRQLHKHQHAVLQQLQPHICSTIKPTAAA